MPFDRIGGGGGGGGGSDAHYVHTQGSAALEWVITHNLGKHPAVTVVDTGGNQLLGAVQHTNENHLVVRFAAATGGKAYLN